MTEVEEEDGILVVQMGGTIDKDYPRNLGGYAFEIGESAVKRIFLRGRVPSGKVEYLSVCRKDSQDIVQEDRNYLVEKLGRQSQSRVLITHGTDTILETAQYLSDHLPAKTSSKLIVITGAFKPETFKDSDADFNIGMSLSALHSLRDKPGIYIAINGVVGPWENFHRNMDTGVYELSS